MQFSQRFALSIFSVSQAKPYLFSKACDQNLYSLEKEATLTFSSTLFFFPVITKYFNTCLVFVSVCKNH